MHGTAIKFLSLIIVCFTIQWFQDFSFSGKGSILNKILLCFPFIQSQMANKHSYVSEEWYKIETQVKYNHSLSLP